MRERWGIKFYIDEEGSLLFDSNIEVFEGAEELAKTLDPHNIENIARFAYNETRRSLEEYNAELQKSS